MKRKKWQWMCVGMLLIGSVMLVFSHSYSADTGGIYVITLDDATINPATADYIIDAVTRANAESAECLIITLDTPGGLLTSTRSIVKSILSSDIPVVVYIAPSGARAGSAGVFITYASHIAAMAPSTNIGAAHPVQLGESGKQRRTFDALRQLVQKKAEEKKGDGIQEDASTEDVSSDDDVMSSKILQDTVAFIKAIARERNRNSEWAELSVTQSSSITEYDAREKNVVEIIAKSERDLVSQLHGRVVVINDKEITLHTQGVVVHHIEMDLRQRILNILANPNIAYIFMMLGFYGLLYEVTHPGIGVPGVMGTIFLILAFFSMQTLPTNYAGLALIALALILFIAEVNTPGFGLLALGGLVSMVLGSLLLFESADPIMRVSFSLIIPLTATTAAITMVLVRLVLLSHRRKVLSGKEGLIGEIGSANTIISPQKEGKVFVHGEIWNAVSNDTIEKDEKIEVTEVNGMMLTVKKC